MNKVTTYIGLGAQKDAIVAAILRPDDKQTRVSKSQTTTQPFGASYQATQDRSEGRRRLLRGRSNGVCTADRGQMPNHRSVLDPRQVRRADQDRPLGFAQACRTATRGVAEAHAIRTRSTPPGPEPAAADPRLHSSSASTRPPRRTQAALEDDRIAVRHLAAALDFGIPTIPRATAWLTSRRPASAPECSAQQLTHA